MQVAPAQTLRRPQAECVCEALVAEAGCLTSHKQGWVMQVAGMVSPDCWRRTHPGRSVI